MKLTLTPIKDLVVIEPKVFGDERGYFYEAYNKITFQVLGLDYDFVQDNKSFSKHERFRRQRQMCIRDRSSFEWRK